MFERLDDFCVLDFNELFSDVHCPISLTFLVAPNYQSENPPYTPKSKDSCKSYVKWDNSLRQNFINGLEDDKISSIKAELDGLLTDPGSVTQASVDSIVGDVKEILLHSANTLNMLKKKRNAEKVPKRKNKNDKPWFNLACKVKRRTFSFCRRRSLLMKNDLFFKAQRDQAAKAYKKTVRQEMRKYNHQMANQLRKLQCKEPKVYWSILNRKNRKVNPNQPSCEAFFDFFKNMNIVNEEENEEGMENDGCKNENENDFLDTPITEAEVLTCIKRLKCNKASGLDNVINEFLKNSVPKMVCLYAKLFNLILDSGKVPHDWVIGVIQPIFKNKGNSTDPGNYRGITILSCFGKLFTSILNERLKKFIETFDIIGCEQAGFRSNFSTLDHLFTLYGLIDILLYKKKRLYCAFLDYEKAFDKVNRSLLWQKLINNGITGKVLRVIQNLYSQAKSCVAVNSDYSNFFCSNIGVRQGENLSPILFAMFLNDMKEFMSDVMTGTPTVARESYGVGLSESETNILLKLFVLLYADDTVIFDETPAGLQKGLDAVKQYCDKWKLSLNAKKCKVVIFSRGKIRRFPDFVIGSEKLEVVYDFMYLGLRLNYNNRMQVAQRDLFARASRAMFALLTKAKSLKLPPDLTIDLFDKTVLPIITYGCEIWGFDINDLVQRLQLKFYKLVLKLRQSTPTFMVFGETGKFPVSVIIKSRMLSFWFNLVSNCSSVKLSSLIYKCLLKMYEMNVHENKYIKAIHTTLNEIGLSYIWLNQKALDIHPVWFKEKVKRCLKDGFLQNWYTHIDNDELFINYRMFKPSFGADPYYLALPQNLVISLMKFRTTNNNLPVNKLQYIDTPWHERLCVKCDTRDIGDEFHYLFVCPFFDVIRRQYLPRHYFFRPNAIKFHALMSSKNKKLLIGLKHLVVFINNSLR